MRKSTTLTREEIRRSLQNQLKLDKEQAGLVLETFLRQLTSSLIRNEEVKLSGFGSFRPKNYPAPTKLHKQLAANGRKIQRRTVIFVASKNLLTTRNFQSGGLKSKPSK